MSEPDDDVGRIVLTLWREGLLAHEDGLREADQRQERREALSSIGRTLVERIFVSVPAPTAWQTEEMKKKEELSPAQLWRWLFTAPAPYACLPYLPHAADDGMREEVDEEWMKEREDLFCSLAPHVIDAIYDERHARHQNAVCGLDEDSLMNLIKIHLRVRGGEFPNVEQHIRGAAALSLCCSTALDSDPVDRAHLAYPVDFMRVRADTTMDAITAVLLSPNRSHVIGT